MVVVKTVQCALAGLALFDHDCLTQLVPTHTYKSLALHGTSPSKIISLGRHSSSLKEMPTAGFEWGTDLDDAPKAQVSKVKGKTGGRAGNTLMMAGAASSMDEKYARARAFLGKPLLSPSDQENAFVSRVRGPNDDLTASELAFARRVEVNQVTGQATIALTDAQVAAYGGPDKRPLKLVVPRRGVGHALKSLFKAVLAYESPLELRRRLGLKKQPVVPAALDDDVLLCEVQPGEEALEGGEITCCAKEDCQMLPGEEALETESMGARARISEASNNFRGTKGEGSSSA